MNNPLGKILILVGLGIVITGIIVYFAGNKLDFLGRLPGDIRIEKENSKFYFPLTTCILLSIIVTTIFKIVQWFMNK